MSENLRVKGQGIPHEQIWAKLENQKLWSRHDQILYGIMTESDPHYKEGF